ncbi:hypothetical protein D0Y65_055279, partial [Glycine soja]
HLKLLELSGILFTLDNSSGYLTLNLPVLKVFKTTNCAWLKAKRITVTAPLQSVIIVQDYKSMSYATSNCMIEFSASRLRDFTYRGYDYISHYFKLLLAKLVTKLPLFGMLSQLELGLVSGEVLLGLLLKSPVLKTLAFKGISKFDKELLNSAAVLECLTSTLQVVKFHKLHGFEHKLCFAKFVMENGLISGEDELLPCQLFMGKSKVIEEFKEKLLLNFHIIFY